VSMPHWGLCGRCVNGVLPLFFDLTATRTMFNSIVLERRCRITGASTRICVADFNPKIYGTRKMILRNLARGSNARGYKQVNLWNDRTLPVRGVTERRKRALARVLVPAFTTSLPMPARLCSNAEHEKYSATMSLAQSTRYAWWLKYATIMSTKRALAVFLCTAIGSARTDFTSNPSSALPSPSFTRFEFLVCVPRQSSI
jgi:hypothetical protein